MIGPRSLAPASPGAGAAAPGLDTPNPAAAAAAVLRKHGRSFHFAGRLLGRRQMAEAATLYAFCRRVDDIADTPTDPARAAASLSALQTGIERGEAGQDRSLAAFLDLAERHDIPAALPIALIDGVAGDLETVRIQDERELRRYAYRVAGTVGQMMARLFGVRDPNALGRAVDLGLAMQVTNIARDVAEDARAGRRYLPEQWLPAVPLTALADPSPDEAPPIATAVARLIEMAEPLYDSGLVGTRALPARPALAIVTAARVYRAIGRRLLARGSDPWAGRTVVPGPAKIGLALTGLPIWAVGRVNRGLPPLPAADHADLADLPGMPPGASG